MIKANIGQQQLDAVLEAINAVLTAAGANLRKLLGLYRRQAGRSVTMPVDDRRSVQQFQSDRFCLSAGPNNFIPRGRPKFN